MTPAIAAHCRKGLPVPFFCCATPGVLPRPDQVSGTSPRGARVLTSSPWFYVLSLPHVSVCRQERVDERPRAAGGVPRNLQRRREQGKFVVPMDLIRTTLRCAIAGGGDDVQDLASVGEAYKACTPQPSGPLNFRGSAPANG
jgi:hypothetical protein